MAFWNWSRTADTNATADPTINWAEGQAPSSVNNSARAMMARLAEWREDISGANVAGGGPINYTLTSNQGFDSLSHMDRQTLTVIIQTTCGDNATINVDGLGAKPIRTSSIVNVTAGTLIAFTPYRMTYFAGTAEFILINFYANPYSIPVGGLMPYLGASAPNSNFVLPVGQPISRTTYATLFALVSTTFGVGDGLTTFNVPDLRTRAIFGQDNMGGSGAYGTITSGIGGLDGTVRGAMGGTQGGNLGQNQLPNVAPSFNGNALGGHSHGPAGGGTFATFVSAAGQLGGSGITIGNPSTTTSDSAGTPSGNISSINGGVTQVALSNMPPAIMLPYILRVI